MTSRAKKDRIFHVGHSKISEILFCDNSDSEDTLRSDDEDIGFLEGDVELFEKNKSSINEFAEVTIELPEPGTSNIQKASRLTGTQQARRLIEDQSPSISKAIDNQTQLQNSATHEPISLKWNKCPCAQNPSQPTNTTGSLSSASDYEFGKILIDVSNTSSPYEVFNNVAKFEKILEEIVIPQTVLCSE